MTRRRECCNCAFELGEGRGYIRKHAAISVTPVTKHV
jgi:hypothetical protein